MGKPNGVIFFKSWREGDNQNHIICLSRLMLSNIGEDSGMIVGVPLIE